MELRQECAQLDRIDLSIVELPERGTVSAIAREIIRRFYEQEFTSKHVYACLLLDSRTKNRQGLKEMARTIVTTEKRAGRIELVRKGKSGECSVYRNKEAA